MSSINHLVDLSMQGVLEVGPPLLETACKKHGALSLAALSSSSNLDSNNNQE